MMSRAFIPSGVDTPATDRYEPWNTTLTGVRHDYIGFSFSCYPRKR